MYAKIVTEHCVVNFVRMRNYVHYYVYTQVEQTH